jgi:hypothetical protein
MRKAEAKESWRARLNGPGRTASRRERYQTYGRDGCSLLSALGAKNPLKRKSGKNRLAFYIVAEIDGRMVGYAGLWCIVDEGILPT